MKKKYIRPSLQSITVTARTHILDTSPHIFTLTGKRNDTYYVDEGEWEDSD